MELFAISRTRSAFWLVSRTVNLTNINTQPAAAGVPAPEHVLRVGGRRPGTLMSFASEASAAAAVEALRAVLRAGKLRLTGFQPGPPGAALAEAPPAGPGGLPDAASAAAAAGAGAGPGPNHGAGVPPPLGEPRGLGPPGRGDAAGAAGGPLPGAPPGAAPGGAGPSWPQDYAPRLPPPEYMSKTLWVGQVRLLRFCYSSAALCPLATEPRARLLSLGRE